MSLILNKAKAIKNNAVNDNLIINGNFDIWQRGSSFTSTEHIADRWFLSQNGSVQAYKKLCNNLENSSFCLRLETLHQSSYTDSSFFMLAQAIESNKIIPLRNKHVSLSFYTRFPSINNWSGNLIVTAKSSSFIDSVFDRVSVSGATLTINPALDSSWLRHYMTFLLPTDCSTLCIEFSPSSNLAADSIIDIAQVKLEAGNFSTNFKPDLEDDKYNSKRFYQKVTAKLKAGTGAGSSQGRVFGTSINLSEPLASNNPIISITEDKNVGLFDVSYNLINNNSAIEIFGRSASPHSEFDTQIVLDSEIQFYKKPITPVVTDIERTSSGINISWSSGLSYLDETIEYSILYGNNSEQLNNIFSTTNISGFISGVGISDPFYGTITAVSTFGESKTSDLFFSNPLFSIPSGITSLTGVWLINKFQLSWDHIIDDGGSPLQRYLIQISNNSGFINQPFYGYGPGSSGYTITQRPRLNYRNISRLRNIEVSGSDPYYARVAGVNSAGTGVFSPTFILNKTVPFPIRNLSTLAINSGITLSYLPPSGDGGVAVSLVQVQHSDSSNFSVSVTKNYRPNYQPITVSGLTNGVGRWFRMRAINVVGTGDWSNYVSGIPNRTLTIPNSPTGLVASWVNTSGIGLNFKSPSDDGGSPIINYTVNIATNSGFSSNSNTFNTINNNPGIQVPTPLYTGTYYLRVKANNSIGGSSYSTGVSIDSTTPDAPIITNLTPLNSGFFISWSTPFGRGSLPLSYSIERSSSSNFSSSITIDNITGVNSYAVTGLANNTIVYTRVKAININGTGDNSSTRSVKPENPIGVPDAGTIRVFRGNRGINTLGSIQRVFKISPMAPIDTGNNYFALGPRYFSLSAILPKNLGSSKITTMHIQASTGDSFDSLTYEYSGIYLENLKEQLFSPINAYPSGHIFRVRFKNSSGFGDWGYGGLIPSGMEAGLTPYNLLWPFLGVARWYNPNNPETIPYTYYSTATQATLNSSADWYFASGTPYSGSFDLFWPYPWDNGGATDLKFSITARKYIGIESDYTNSEVIETTGEVYSTTSGIHPMYLSSGLKMSYSTDKFGPGTYDFIVRPFARMKFPNRDYEKEPLRITKFPFKSLRMTNLGYTPVQPLSPISQIPQLKPSNRFPFLVATWGTYTVIPIYDQGRASDGTEKIVRVGWGTYPTQIEPYADPSMMYFAGVSGPIYGDTSEGLGVINIVGSNRSLLNKNLYPSVDYSRAFFQFNFDGTKLLSSMFIAAKAVIGNGNTTIRTTGRLDGCRLLYFNKNSNSYVDTNKRLSGTSMNISLGNLETTSLRLLSPDNKLILLRVSFR